ncbi:MAG TPA: amidohydrolase family protein [Dehalococcoidia bacterium]|nr:amidohydrolase family protein [Dehalococcoidia bacterium]
MPVIDFHMHPAHYDAPTPAFLRWLEEQRGEPVDRFVARYGSPEAVVELLGHGGCRCSILTPGLVSNEYIARFCAASDRLIPFCSLNPYLTGQPGRELRRLVNEEGFRGLKLYPTYQYFFPNDHLLYPNYDAAQDLGIPVMFHTGSSVFPGSRLKYGDPIHLDDVAVDFSEMPIVLAQGGRPFWTEQAAFLARLHRNVYLEISGIPPARLMNWFPELDQIGNKSIYGTDWPGVPTIVENVQAIRDVPISERSKEAILSDTAAKLLKIDRPRGGA